MRISDWSSDVCSSDLVVQYKAIKLVKRPELQITPDSFEVVSMQVPVLQAGEILLKQTHMSLDPAMRGWMSADRHSYIPPVELGDIMRSSGAAEVVESKNEKLPVGTKLTRSEAHTSELQSLMRISYAVFCLKKKQ